MRLCGSQCGCKSSLSLPISLNICMHARKWWMRKRSAYSHLVLRLLLHFIENFKQLLFDLVLRRFNKFVFPFIVLLIQAFSPTLKLFPWKNTAKYYIYWKLDMTDPISLNPQRFDKVFQLNFLHIFVAAFCWIDFFLCHTILNPPVQTLY